MMPMMSNENSDTIVRQLIQKESNDSSLAQWWIDTE